MKKVLFTIFLFSAFSSLSAAQTTKQVEKQSNNIILPVFDDSILKFSLDNTWQNQVTNSLQNKTQYTSEFLKKGETFNTWKELISVNGTKLDNLDMKKFIDTFKKANENSEYCEKGHSEFHIIKENKNDIVFLTRCNSIKNQNSGEITYYKAFIKPDRFIIIFNSYKIDKKDLKNKNKISLLVKTKEFEKFNNLIKTVLLCTKDSTDKLCSDIINKTYSKTFNKLTYKIPDGYALNKEIADKIKTTEVILEKGSSLEDTKKPIILLKIAEKDNRSNIKSLSALDIQSYKNNFKDFRLRKWNPNNIDLHKADFIAIDFYIPNSELNNTPNPARVIYINLKDKVYVFSVFTEKLDNLRDDFVNDFFNSIKFE